MIKVYFEGVATSQLKDAYRRLAQTMHPDKGGDTTLFQNMKSEYEQRVKGSWKTPEPNTEKQKYSDPEEYYDFIRRRERYYQNYHCRYTATIDKFMQNPIREVELDGNRWTIQLKPNLSKYDHRIKLNMDGEILHLLHVHYVQDYLDIRVKEHAFTKSEKYVDGFVYTPENRYIGSIRLETKTVFSNSKTMKIVPSDIYTWVGIDLDDWEIKDWNVNITRFKEPTAWYARMTLWISRKCYSLFNRKMFV